MSAPDPIISVKNAGYHYQPDKEVLRNVTFDVQPAEFIAFAGQNGAGKTTCAKLLNGILRPLSGEVRVNGLDTRSVPASQIARTVGYCYQNPDHQIWALKVEDELAFGPHNLGLPGDEIEQRVCEALALVGLSDERTSYTFSLGWGQRQKLAVASILAMRPQVIIVDEPTTGLDWEGSLRIMDLLAELNRTGLTVIIISHDMEIIARYARRLIVFAAGQVVADGPTGEVMYDLSALEQADLRPPQFIRMSIALQPFGFTQQVTSPAEFKQHLQSLLTKTTNHVNR